MAKATKSWDDPENEVNSNFIKWGAPGDYVMGTLMSVRKTKSTLPDKAGELQFVYDIKVHECEYHDIDEKKKVAADATVIEADSIISVGGRVTIDTKMSRAKVGQIVGLKFIEEVASKTKGYNATKVIRVYLPKGPDGEYEMDEEVVNATKDELDQFPGKK
jgi:hypothetical protein